MNTDQSNAKESPVEAAFSRLTDQWQPLSHIRLEPGAGALGFAELVLEGRAVVRMERAANPGQRIQYKLKPASQRTRKSS